MLRIDCVETTRAIIYIFFCVENRTRVEAGRPIRMLLYKSRWAMIVI